MPRTIAAILLIALLAIGGGFIAVTAYQAGLGTAVTTAVAEGGATVVAPLTPYGYGYGYGWHPGGFGFFGFLGTLFFLFLVFGLIRAIFFRGGPGRGGWGRGWGGPGAWGNGDHDHNRGRNLWESRIGESFDEWHRRAHDPDSSKEPPASNSTSKPA
jgi:hypothetical protein